MKDIYSAIGKIVLTMFCFGMLSQSNVLHAQANAAGPICGKAFLSEPGPGMYWSEAANVRCDDNEDRAYAAPLTKGQFTQVLKVTDFGFALPADARVEGIEVVIIRKGDVSDGVVDRSVMLLHNGVAGGSNLRSRDLWEDSWTAAYYGDEHEDWDNPWTVKDVNSAGFGVAISVQGEGVIARPQIDEVLVTVHFSYGAASGRTHKASSSATRNTCNGWGS